jgi:hypothetical protein
MHKIQYIEVAVCSSPIPTPFSRASWAIPEEYRDLRAHFCHNASFRDHYVPRPLVFLP